MRGHRSPLAVAGGKTLSLYFYESRSSLSGSRDQPARWLTDSTQHRRARWGDSSLMQLSRLTVVSTWHTTPIPLTHSRRDDSCRSHNAPNHGGNTVSPNTLYTHWCPSNKTLSSNNTMSADVLWMRGHVGIKPQTHLFQVWLKVAALVNFTKTNFCPLQR